MKMRIQLKAICKDEVTQDFDAVISFRDVDNKSREIFLPRSDLEDIRMLRKTLMNAGCYFANKEERSNAALVNLATASRKAPRWNFAAQTGWRNHQRQFVHPAGVIGKDRKRASVKPPRLAIEGQASKLRISGSHQRWAKHVAGPSAYSSRLVFGICMALAAPLLKCVDRSSFGVLVHGPAKAGKSTMLLVAGSVGGFGTEDDLPNFHATDAALGEIPASFNDMLLPMNELGLLKGSRAERAQRMQTLSYVLAEGRGTTYSRLAPVNRGKGLAQWKCIALASGEESTDQISEAASRNRAVGAAIRWIDLCATRTGAVDIFDYCPEDVTASCRTSWVRGQCETLRRHCRSHHGIAFDHYIKRLIRRKAKVESTVQDLVQTFVLSVAEKSDGQAVTHLAASFGLIAAAGIIGIRFGTLPWPEKLVLRSVKRCYRDARKGVRTEDDLLQEGLTIFGSSVKSKLLMVSSKISHSMSILKSADGFLRKDSAGKHLTIRGEAFKTWFADPRQAHLVLRYLREKNWLVTHRGSMASSSTSISWAESQPMWPDQVRRRSIEIKLPREGAGKWSK